MSKKQTTNATDENRRRVLKGVTIGGGSIALTKWSKPIVETVVLPAHAQATGPTNFTADGFGSGTTAGAPVLPAP